MGCNSSKDQGVTTQTPVVYEPDADENQGSTKSRQDGELVKFIKQISVDADEDNPVDNLVGFSPQRIPAVNTTAVSKELTEKGRLKKNESSNTDEGERAESTAGSFADKIAEAVTEDMESTEKDDYEITKENGSPGKCDSQPVGGDENVAENITVADDTTSQVDKVEPIATPDEEKMATEGLRPVDATPTAEANSGEKTEGEEDVEGGGVAEGDQKERAEKEVEVTVGDRAEEEQGVSDNAEMTSLSRASSIGAADENKDEDKVGEVGDKEGNKEGDKEVTESDEDSVSAVSLSSDSSVSVAEGLSEAPPVQVEEGSSSTEQEEESNKSGAKDETEVRVLPDIRDCTESGDAGEPPVGVSSVELSEKRMEETVPGSQLKTDVAITKPPPLSVEAPSSSEEKVAESSSNNLGQVVSKKSDAKAEGGLSPKLAGAGKKRFISAANAVVASNRKTRASTGGGSTTRTSTGGSLMRETDSQRRSREEAIRKREALKEKGQQANRAFSSKPTGSTTSASASAATSSASVATRKPSGTVPATRKPGAVKAVKGVTTRAPGGRRSL